MKISHVYETIDESVTRKPSRDEQIACLERKKRSLLHEMKILSVQMKTWTDAGYVSQMGETAKYPDKPKIPDSERHILTTDECLSQKMLRTFARFTTAKEILGNSIMPELQTLQTEQDKGEKKV